MHSKTYFFYVLPNVPLPKTNEMKKECIFEIGGEGGSIAIYREKRKTGTVYIYDHNETDFSDEGMNIAIKNEYSTFEAAMYKLSEKFPWHFLYLLNIHEEYKQVVSVALINKLNALSEHEKWDFEKYSKSQFEKMLGVRFELVKERVFTDLYDLTIKPIEESLSHSSNLFKELNIVGTVEIQFNSLIIKDENNQMAFIFPSDKFMVELLPVNITECLWRITSN